MNLVQIFIKDGNFSPYLRTAFILIGAGIVFISLEYVDSLYLMSLGIFFSALGGYSSRAKTLGLKPFEKGYRKNRETYRENDGDQ